jgi:hypothetical protein
MNENHCRHALPIDSLGQSKIALECQTVAGDLHCQFYRRKNHGLRPRRW